MAIVEQTTIESRDGVKKTIDKQSMGMALDILQRGLYSFPIKSTVRELASNAHDAIKERDVATAIIAGKEKVEDHFDMSKSDEGIYHASLNVSNINSGMYYLILRTPTRIVTKVMEVK